MELSGIGKSFGANRVLDGVSIDLKRGEVHVLAGENGAGKSTLIKILAGIHTEYDGAILLKGRRVRFHSPQEASRHGIAVIHQELSLVETLSVSDNIHLGRENERGGGLWLDRRAEVAHAIELCRKVGLEFTAAEMHQPVGSFPLAIRNCIEIAKALGRDAEIVVMDEPTSALGREEVERLFTLIEALKQSGCGIVYISHKMEEIYRLADRITVLRDGRRVGSATAHECPRAELVRLMIGRELTQQFPARGASVPVAETPVLELRDFRVRAQESGAAAIVDGLSFRVNVGETVGLAGLQGAGAAALLHAVFGAQGRACEGEVVVCGREFAPGDPRRAIACGLSLVTADRLGTGLVQKLSVEKNITLAALPRLSPGGVLSPQRDREAATRQSRELRIRLASLEQDVDTLSGGNQQKTAIAKSLETRPRVLLLEDPMRGVDVGAKHEIYELLQRLTAQGMAIVLYSTELPELLGLCDRILVLHRGRLAAEFSRADATPGKIIAAAMGAGEGETEAA